VKIITGLERVWILNSKLRIQVDSEVESHGTERRLIAKPEAHSVREFTEMNVRNAREYIARVVKQRCPESFDWDDSQRRAVLEITDRHHVSAFGPRLIETESAQGCRAARKVTLGRRQRCCPAERMIPAKANGRCQDTAGNGRIHAIQVIERCEIQF